MPYLLRSEQLMKLLTLATSKKSKLALINTLVPRLVDPKSQAEYFRGLFTFTTDQQIVDMLIRNRTNEIKLSRYALCSPKRTTTTENLGGSTARRTTSLSSRRPPPVKAVATLNRSGGNNISPSAMKSISDSITPHALHSPNFMSPLHTAGRPSPTVTPLLVNPLRGKRVSYLSK